MGVTVHHQGPWPRSGEPGRGIRVHHPPRRRPGGHGTLPAGHCREGGRTAQPRARATGRRVVHLDGRQHRAGVVGYRRSRLRDRVPSRCPRRGVGGKGTAAVTGEASAFSVTATSSRQNGKMALPASRTNCSTAGINAWLMRRTPRAGSEYRAPDTAPPMPGLR